MKAIRLALLAATMMAGLLCSTIAVASDIVLPPDELLDPSTLHIGPGYGTACAMGCAGDPNVFAGTHADVFQNSGGASPLQYLAIIVAVANGNSGSLGVGAVTNSVLRNPSGFNPISVTTTGLGYQGVLTASTGTSTHGASDIYGVLGLNLGSANQSNNFGNLAGFDQSHFGISNITSFAIFAYQINIDPSTGKTLNGSGYVDFDLAGLPQGTYIVGYGFDSSKVYSTPFTEAGDTSGNNVPEPASLALFGSGLLALGGTIRKRFVS